MSQAPTMTQGPSTSGSGKKRRLNSDDEGGQGLDDQIQPSDSDSDLGESSDGELTHQDLLERKRRKKAMQKELTQIRHRDEGIGKAAQAHLTPNSATPLARAIQEFTKMLMGIPRKSRNSSSLDIDAEPRLPEAPTDDERHNWLTRKQTREDFIRNAQDKGMKKYLSKKPPGYIPNRKQRKMVEHDSAEAATLKNPMRPVVFKSRMASGGRSRYAHHWGTQCEAALAMAGFPRATFDWNASWDTPWNSTTSSIILAQWVKVYDANGARNFGILSSENTAANREEILRRWVSNKMPKYNDQTRRVDEMKTPAGKQRLIEKDAEKQGIARKRRLQTKIQKMRKDEAVNLFGQDSTEVEMISHPEIHSEDEYVAGNFGSRQRKRLEWRSTELDVFINLLDKCHPGRKILPREKRVAQQLIERGPYAPDPEPDACPPRYFQESLVNPAWLEQQTGLIVAELQLNGEESVNINRAIQEAKGTLKRRGVVLSNETQMSG
ncbi:uncharacterized protein MELLADRAFT_94556 [Melampsora larici-populina 98AG31]|uniref:Uncharacterized protein n=1 Tax=Melampsora larici-populina (strain 98AG31 / pathotype 3-4-7) TaxID=747676 RepID=F4RBV0_MELLP|nr:uncharacterized protein MELLADRAFT_94556 [Melampsora larici-populina 98AG31]EGG10278.1 hypothetical protein MELLADRAFT_94556 [Melampsora larici-populina 98AG31]